MGTPLTSTILTLKEVTMVLVRGVPMILVYDGLAINYVVDLLVIFVDYTQSNFN